MAYEKNKKNEGGGKTVACWNGFWGCGSKFRVLNESHHGAILSAENYNPATRTCLSCSNREAHNWEIAFDSLPFLMSAMQNARAGKMGKDGSKEDVWNLMNRMGVKQVKRNWKDAVPVNSESQMPVHDRVGMDF